ncbi:MAG: hypothetical protein R3B13_05030 [Polyangiaceae bacterium]
MISRVTSEFRREAREFRLRYCCEDCAHFEPDEARCAHEYPCEAHRQRDLESCHEVVFCKEFELA